MENSQLVDAKKSYNKWQEHRIFLFEQINRIAEIFEESSPSTLQWGDYIYFENDNVTLSAERDGYCGGTDDYSLTYPEQYLTMDDQSLADIFAKQKAKRLQEYKEVEDASLKRQLDQAEREVKRLREKLAK